MRVELLNLPRNRVASSFCMRKRVHVFAPSAPYVQYQSNNTGYYWCLQAGTFSLHPLPAPEPKATCRLQLVADDDAAGGEGVAAQLSAMTVQHGDMGESHRGLLSKLTHESTLRSPPCPTPCSC